jgi:hypothetical protein
MEVMIQVKDEVQYLKLISPASSLLLDELRTVQYMPLCFTLGT